MRRSKRYLKSAGTLERGGKLPLQEAIGILKKMEKTKFDETVELSCHLGVDPKKADQMVRSVVTLPHGSGKQIRIIVFAQGQKLEEAKKAGADVVGGNELAEKIAGGWLEFEAAIATPDMMKIVSKLGRILGPRGMMPNAKAGTISFELERVVGELKAGRTEFRVDRGANIHLGFGKASFAESQLFENASAALSAILAARPSGCKGQYLKSAAVSSCMGPGIKLDINQLGV